MIRSTTISFFLIVLLSSCATFYNVTFEFNQELESGDFVHAEHFLDKNKQFKKPKNVLLYYMNKGYVLRQQHKFKESNVYFNKADLYIEDKVKSVGKEALALVTNDGVRPYVADGFEQLMIHYYKALNYMTLNEAEGALVEVRRMDLMISKLEGTEKRLSKKIPESYAFIQNLMGLVYEASGDFNNAFISYRNSYNNYKESAMGVPSQLKNDLLYTASAMGFNSDVKRYEKEFGIQYDASLYKERQAVVFWENGMGPVKDEWSLNFTVNSSGGGNTVYFVNDDQGLSFPFTVSSSTQKQNLLGLGITRIAVPKLVDRRNKFTKGNLVLDGKSYELEIIQDVNNLARETQKSELVANLSKTLLRFALKKVAELKLQEENEALGALAMISNAVTEKADTRNWQSLPAEISYTRIPINTVETEIILNVSNESTSKEVMLPFNKLTKKKVQFIYHHTTSSWGI